MKSHGSGLTRIDLRFPYLEAPYETQETLRIESAASGVGTVQWRRQEEQKLPQLLEPGVAPYSARRTARSGSTA